MKKTISIHIKGMSFTIEEDAYELLQDYLERLSLTFAEQDGGSEILEDIEIRIAELFSGRLSESKTVIEQQDVKDVLAVLGDPEEFAGDTEDEEETASSKNTAYDGPTEKRLFRDEENAVLGGVCSGIANYFGIDPVITRIIFVVMMFAGFGFLLYLILWVAVPKTRNTIDRLRMKGRPITVENVKAEVENAADRLKNSSRNFAKKFGDRDVHKRRVSNGVRIFTTAIGFLLVGIGLLQLIAFLIFIVGGTQIIPVQSEQGFISLTDLGALVMSNSGDVNLAWFGVSMVSMGSILFLLLLGSMLIFRLRNTWSKLSLLGLFLTGLAGILICAAISMRTMRDMAVEGEIRTEIGAVSTNELTIVPQMNRLSEDDEYQIVSNGEFGFFNLEKGKIISYGVQFEFVRSPDTLYHVYQNLSTRGISNGVGERKSKHIDHGSRLLGDSLLVDTEFSFPEKDKLRWQTVLITIEIPKGGRVKFKDRVVHLSSEDDDSEDVDHPFYSERGYMYGDGSYSHDSWW